MLSLLSDKYLIQEQGPPSNVSFLNVLEHERITFERSKCIGPEDDEASRVWISKGVEHRVTSASKGADCQTCRLTRGLSFKCTGLQGTTRQV